MVTSDKTIMMIKAFTVLVLEARRFQRFAYPNRMM